MDNSESESKMVPLKEGLFSLPSSPDGKAQLIGSKCKNCSHYFWPRSYVCLNCGKDNLVEVPLSTRGKIWTYAVARMAPAESLIPAPFIIAQVQLPEKVLVKTIVDNCDPDAVAIGMDVEFTLKKVGQDEEGHDIVAFAFKPI